jgi:predicted methyltransferase
MGREFIAHSTKTLHFPVGLSTSASSHHDLSLAAFITNIVESDFSIHTGYSTELMARAIAPSGVVFGQNPADIGERAKTRFEARLKTPAGKNIVSVARPFDDPLPADVRYKHH